MKFIDATQFLSDPDMEWRDVVGFEGLYQVSSCGLVASLGNKTNHKLPILLKPNTDKDGYYYVTLKDNKKGKTLKIHKLVATAFIPNHSSMEVINHIDENRQNNYYTNLEWCSPDHNWRVGSVGRSQQKVVKLSITGEFISIYDSLMEAARQNNINQGNITNCLKGRCKSVGGFKWKLLEDNKESL
jgi:hypothetical protein